MPSIIPKVAKSAPQKTASRLPFQQIGGAAGYCLRVRKISMVPFYMLSLLFRQHNPIAAKDKTMGALIESVGFGEINSLLLLPLYDNPQPTATQSWTSLKYNLKQMQAHKAHA